jgi:hypothetical protein
MTTDWLARRYPLQAHARLRRLPVTDARQVPDVKRVASCASKSTKDEPCMQPGRIW